MRRQEELDSKKCNVNYERLSFSPSYRDVAIGLGDLLRSIRQCLLGGNPEDSGEGQWGVADTSLLNKGSVSLSITHGFKCCNPFLLS